MTGAVFGFCLGLFIDVSLYQTLGVSSLVFTAVGYGAGRIRELRDPAHGLAPVAVGAAATAIAAIGFTLLQFLLGVQAPGLAAAAARDPDDRSCSTRCSRCPSTRSCAAHCCPFLPEDPRRRRRRAYTTGGLSPISRALMPQTSRRTRPADHAPAGVARRRARRHRVRAVRDRLLPALVPAGADGRGGGHAGARQPRAQGAHRGAARRHRGPQQRQARAHQDGGGRADGARASCPRACARTPTTTARTLAAAENDRLKAQDQLRRLPAPAQRRRAQGHQGREARARARCASRPDAHGPSRSPIRAPADETDADRALPAHGPRCCEISPEDDPQARDPRDRRRAVLQRHDPHRRAARRSSTTCASTPRSSRASSSSERYLRRYPHERARRAAVRARVRDRPGAAQGEASTRASPRARGSARAGSRSSYDKYLRGTDGYQRVVVDAFGAPRRPAQVASVTRAQAGPAAEADARLQPAEGGRRGARRRRSQHSAATAPAPAPTWRWTRATARSWRWAPQPGFDASVFAQAVHAEDLGLPDLATRRARRCSTARPSRRIRSARRSSRSPRWRRSRPGLINADDKIDDDGHYELGPQKYQNAKGASFGSIDMSDALKVSSDIFFFQLGAQANDQEPRRSSAGRASSASAARPASTCRRGAGPGARPQVARRRPSRSTRRASRRTSLQIADDGRALQVRRHRAPWTTGDNVNLAVGQGDLQATPLQVAVAYSALANNGTIVTPHLGQAIEDGNGVTIQELPHKPRRKIKIDPARPRRSCSTACGAPPARTEGTSADVFKGWPMRVHGLRQDRHRRAPAEPRPGLVRLLRQGRRRADRGRRDRREGRLRRGTLRHPRRA